MKRYACDACYQAYNDEETGLPVAAEDLEPGTECTVCEGAGNTTVWTGEEWLSSLDRPMLREADTGDVIGRATAEQIIASAAAGPQGFFLIDEDEEPSEQFGTRRVYVR